MLAVAHYPHFDIYVLNYVDQTVAKYLRIERLGAIASLLFDKLDASLKLACGIKFDALSTLAFSQGLAMEPFH